MSVQPRTVNFNELQSADLIIDAVYKGGNNGNISDDPISKLLGCSNQGGFRPLGSVDPLELKFVALYSSLMDPDWPDALDSQIGTFTYFGDNKEPGKELHNTIKKGNKILKNVFDITHNEKENRNRIPPFFVFTKGASGRDVTFKGVAVPGAKNLTSNDDLVAIWKIKDQQRFQNYRAVFTILDVGKISRNRIKDLQSGIKKSAYSPKAYDNWVETGSYEPLIAERSIEYRSKAEQLPLQKDVAIIKAVHDYFEDGYSFEHCAAEILKLMDENYITCDLTRPWIDGGRDAVGKYRIGLNENCILVDYAMEAKRYELNKPITIKETSRLISRLRHRQFGVLITTSYVHHQTYKEIKEDGHPIVIICAKDIISILRNAGIASVDSVQNWLSSNFERKI